MNSRRSKPSQIQDIIATSERLSAMPSESQMLSRIDRGIKSIINGQLADHCQIGRLDGNTLIYYTDSPIWAYTFKMAKHTILTTLRQLATDLVGMTHHGDQSQQQALAAFSRIEDIQIRVKPYMAPARSHATQSRKPLPKLSKAVGLSITHTAETLKDKEVAKAWKAFAQKHAMKD